MIGYTSLGTNNLTVAAGFYDAIFALFKAARTFEVEDFIVWGDGNGGAQFSVHTPYDGKLATVGNGVMIALQATSKEMVDAVYDRALSLGGRNEGEPGLRMEGFYAAYFRDLDGNKLNVHCFSSR